MFIVEIVGPGGVRSWIVVNASSQAEARQVALQQAETGFSPNLVVTADDLGVQQLRSDSPGFSTAFPTNQTTTASIIEGLGGATTGTGSSTGTGSGGEGDFAGGTGSNIGGGGQGSDALDADFNLNREAFEFGPGFEAGLRDRGINIGGGGGLLGRIANTQQRQLEDRFFTQEALRPGGELTEQNAAPTFSNFLSGRVGDQFSNQLFGRGGAQASRELLNRARSFGSPGTEGTLPSLLAGGLLNPATKGQGNTLANVALNAGRERFGSLSRFLPSAGNLSQTFLSQDRPQELTFADFLNQKIFGSNV